MSKDLIAQWALVVGLGTLAYMWFRLLFKGPFK